MQKIEIGGFKRISKAAAKKFYDQNKTVYFCPVKLSPINIWQPAAAIKKENIEFYNRTFENVYNEFWYYNCDNERGNYIAFYTREEGET